jgi:hypothetical protein
MMKVECLVTRYERLLMSAHEQWHDLLHSDASASVVSLPAEVLSDEVAHDGDDRIDLAESSDSACTKSVASESEMDGDTW